ncbi:MAG: IclR family transcriptional regulator [Hyphomicrobiaceae bacterium]
MIGSISLNTSTPAADNDGIALADTTAAKTNGGSSTVARAVAILRIAAAETCVTPTMVARALDVDKSTGSRLIRTLAGEGLLMPNGTSRGGYILGPAILELAASLYRRVDLQQLAVDVMTELRNLTEETVSIQRRIGEARVCVAQVPSQQPVRWVIETGQARPITAGSSAKVLLAALRDEEIAPLLSESRLRRYTPNTLDRNALLADLKNVRTNGYAMSIGERIDGVSGIAVPIRSVSGGIIAALAVSGPSGRWTKDRMLAHLDAIREGAARISARIWDDNAFAN